MKFITLCMLIPFFVQAEISTIEAPNPPCVKINFELSLNGEKITTASVISQDNEKATMTHTMTSLEDKEVVIEVIPQIQKVKNNQSIYMKFKVGIKENGLTKTISTPRITTLDNETAEVSSSCDSNECQNYDLKVTPSVVK